MRSTTRNAIRLTHDTLRKLAEKGKIESEYLFIELMKELPRPFTIKTHTDIALVEEDMEQLRKVGYIANPFLSIKLLNRRREL